MTDRDVAMPTGSASALAGSNVPLVRELGELAYEFEAPFVLDGSKYLRTFGGAPTSHREAIRATLGWYAGQATASERSGRPGTTDGVAAAPRARTLARRA